MPRIGHILSALLVALISVMIVLLFCITGVQRSGASQAVSTPDVADFPAPLIASSFAAPSVAAAPAPPPATTLVIVITAADRGPGSRSPATEIQESPAPHDGGRALIEHFIELTKAPHGTVSPTPAGAS